jgi:DNA-binding transcriptional MerR regulator
MDHGLTIEELAQRAATKTSTIRMYQSRGLLPPPQVTGRVGYYSTGHLTRLRVIARLQERGYSLNAIRDLFDGWTKGASLTDVLGLEQELASGTDRAGSGPVEITHEDFADLFAGGEVDMAAAQRAVALGLVTFDEVSGTVRTPSRAFLAVGRELGRHGVPSSASLDEYELLAADTRRIAGRFVALFERYAVTSEDIADATSARLLADRIRQFRELAALAVQDLMSTALDEATADAVARHVSGDGKP